MMAKRPSWSGFLKLSLVTCPIRLFSATTAAQTVSFHFIHPKTRNRIQMKPFDPDLGPVERKDLVRGYEIDDGKYVTVTDDDLTQIRLKSTKTIEIEKFVDLSEIDPIYFDHPYFVLPDGKMALEAYAVIREAMKKEGKAGQGRLVLSYREHVATIQPRGNGLILHRMRDAREIESDKILGEIKATKVDSQMVEIASQIIEQKEGVFEPAEFKDPYEEALIDLLKRRARGAKPIHPAEEPEKPTNVVNLMDALRRSVGAEKGRSKAREAAGSDERNVVEFRKPRRRARPKSASRRHRAASR
jgi:DNA end-binding protein Ku